MAEKIKKLTVRDLIDLFRTYINHGRITMDTEVWLSKDGEGNSYSPLIQMSDGEYNVGFEKDRSRVTLYPCDETT